jgi:hypothetical protein
VSASLTFVLLSLGALGAALALLSASFQLSALADVLAIGSAVCGLAAFVSVAGITIQRARQMPPRRDRP